MKRIVLAMSILGLVACSQYASTGEKIYLQSRNGATINVPPPLTAANIGHFYDLPTPAANFNIKSVEPSSAIARTT
ncbi:hypothetical protein [Legionella gresilensis]|uniref:hypothetical protein n=1 Tax=Legionella gresilensis TaxID=91823 RepID=UPI001041489E|nr:hypothetical protein [Legionella gresilensis]